MRKPNESNRIYFTKIGKKDRNKQTVYHLTQFTMEFLIFGRWKNNFCRESKKTKSIAEQSFIENQKDNEMKFFFNIPNDLYRLHWTS